VARLELALREVSGQALEIRQQLVRLAESLAAEKPKT
jgi:hypothetical protein